MILLGLTGVPAQMQGIFITTPNGYFEVAEACSGAKFVIAMTAYGLLVCNVCFTSWRRRVAFMVGALSLSILANGVRAFATIFVAEVTTRSEEHTSELQSLMRISYAVFCLKKN